MAKKKDKAPEVKVKTLEDKIQENNTELIKSMASALNTSLLTMAALEHAKVVMDETQRICKEAGSDQKINRKRYAYLSGKANDLHKVHVALIAVLDKTLGLKNMDRNLQAIDDVYADLYDCVEITEDDKVLVK